MPPRGQPGRTWVSGPPGAGKTTLVSTYVERRGLPFSWYHLDSTDADPASFFFHLTLAARTLLGRRRVELPPLTPEYALGIEAFARGYFRRLFDAAGRRFCLVLDDCHAVPAAAPFGDLLRVACEELPAGGEIVMVGRKEAPASLARLLANGDLRSVGAAELRLTDDEATALARRRRRRDLGGDEVRALNRRVEGWAAGLVLGLRQPGDEAPVPHLAPGSLLFEYFAVEILQALPLDEQRALVRVSALPSVGDEDAAVLTGSAAAPALLARFAAEGLFVSRTKAGGRRFRLHPLFREFLASQAAALLGDDGVRALQVEAAGRLEASGELEAAFSALADAEAWERATAFVTRHAPALAETGRLAIVFDWTSALPPSARDPWVTFWRGLALAQRDPRAGKEVLGGAFAAFRESSDDAGTLLAWAAVVETIFHEYHALAEMDGWLTLLDAGLASQNAAAPPPIRARVALSALIAASFRAVPGAWTRWHDELSSLVEALPDASSRTTARAYLTVDLVWRGRAAEARQRLDAYWPQMRGTPLASIFHDMVDATIWLYHGELERCRESAERGLATSADSGIHFFDVNLLWLVSCALLDGGDLAAARRVHETLGRVMNPARNPDLACFHMIAARLRALQGEPAAAACREALALGEAGGMTYLVATWRALAACIELEEGRLDEAEALVRRCLADARAFDNAPLEFMALLARARLEWLRGEAGATATLRAAMELGARHDFVHFFVWEPRTMAHLCRQALAEGLSTGFVRRLVAVNRLSPPHGIDPGPNWPSPARVLSLGGFRLERDGKPVTFVGKVQKAPLRLLKAIISLGGDDVSEEKVADLLWPDSDGDAARQALATALARLRRLLGAAAITRQGGRLGIDRRTCWVDVLALFDVLGSEGDDEERLARVEALYRGPFLADSDEGPWAELMRERAREGVMQLARRCAGQAQNSGDLERAVDLCERGLALDAAAEPLWLELMRSLVALGRPTEAAAALGRCRAALAAHTGGTPSAALQSLVGATAGTSGGPDAGPR
jgi:ATP/maltotriose-dependent transcriptional regulator MalT/DNA-binding SARP family transcriptional activator